MFRYQGNTRQLEKCCGTVPYIAPEVLSRKPYDAEPADIWSCAVILVALLAGGMTMDLIRSLVIHVSCKHMLVMQNGKKLNCEF